MIADWQTIVSSDNDVHECFVHRRGRALQRLRVWSALTAAWAPTTAVHASIGDNLAVEASEPQIKTLYTNLTTPMNVSFDGAIKKIHN